MRPSYVNSFRIKATQGQPSSFETGVFAPIFFITLPFCMYFQYLFLTQPPPKRKQINTPPPPAGTKIKQLSGHLESHTSAHFAFATFLAVFLRQTRQDYSGHLNNNREVPENLINDPFASSFVEKSCIHSGGGSVFSYTRRAVSSD